MNDKNIQIRKLASSEPIPYGLLLLADETLQAIYRYIFASLIYILESEARIIGVYVMYAIDSKTAEIKNIAVAEEFQNRGYGTSMLHHAMARAKESEFEEIIIGTPDIATKQIRLYKQVGFEPFEVRKNFFIENYTTPIYENGEQLKDKVMLRKRLQGDA